MTYPSRHGQHLRRKAQGANTKPKKHRGPSRCPHLHIESGTVNGAEVYRCKACRQRVERVVDGAAFVAASKGE